MRPIVATNTYWTGKDDRGSWERQEAVSQLEGDCLFSPNVNPKVRPTTRAHNYWRSPTAVGSGKIVSRNSDWGSPPRTSGRAEFGAVCGILELYRRSTGASNAGSYCSTGSDQCLFLPVHKISHQNDRTAAQVHSVCRHRGRFSVFFMILTAALGHWLQRLREAPQVTAGSVYTGGQGPEQPHIPSSFFVVA